MSNRKDCPQCGRPNSVKIRTENGYQSEHCFGVDCNYFVKEQQEFDVSNLKTTERRTLDKKLLVEARSHPASLEFLQKHYISDANANIYYYPRHNRVVFNYKDMYVGRSLDKSVQPKWLVYADSYNPFVVQRYKHGRSEQVILVEDCVSACNAARLYDSIALLSTTLKDSYLSEVLKYDTIYVALDEDAGTKALKIQRILGMVKDCRVVLLTKDIKYLAMDELEGLFK